MENAADALKIAFIIFVFIAAIGIAFTLISQAKSTADFVLYYSDDTNFYEYAISNNEKNRIVLVSEIIPTLYRYCKESIGIEIKLKDGTSYFFDLGNREYLVEQNENIYDKEFNREENLGKFIKEILLDELKDKTFKEQFIEIPFSGIYKYGDDGTELEIASGGKKIYITYIEK